MSELPFADDDSDEPEPPTRGRALWAFGALASAAVIVVALMVFLLGDPNDSTKHDHDQLAIPETSNSGAAVTAPARTTHTSTPPSTRTSTKSTAATSHAAPRSSCPSSDACVSPGDPGEVIAAINAYRHDHGAPAITGKVTADAQKCALQEGDEHACPASYSWEPVETAAGAKVIEKLVARGGGGSWLLDSGTKSFAVGWAFVPAAHGDGGHYSCAIIALR